jgi:hypothetical protein
MTQATAGNRVRHRTRFPSANKSVSPTRRRLQHATTKRRRQRRRSTHMARTNRERRSRDPERVQSSRRLRIAMTKSIFERRRVRVRLMYEVVGSPTTNARHQPGEKNRKTASLKRNLSAAPAGETMSFNGLTRKGDDKPKRSPQTGKQHNTSDLSLLSRVLVRFRSFDRPGAKNFVLSARRQRPMLS